MIILVRHPPGRLVLDLSWGEGRYTIHIIVHGSTAGHVLIRTNVMINVHFLNQMCHELIEDYFLDQSTCQKIIERVLINEISGFIT